MFGNLRRRRMGGADDEIAVSVGGGNFAVREFDGVDVAGRAWIADGGAGRSAFAMMEAAIVSKSVKRTAKRIR